MTDVINASRTRVIDLTGTGGLDDERSGCDRFEAFYEEYLPRVRAFSRKLVHDRHAVEDIVQEAFLRAFHAGIHLEPDGGGDGEGEGDGEQEAWPWLATVTRNLVLDLHRRNRTVSADELEEEIVEDDQRRDDPEVVVLANRRRSGIAEALDSVCERQRRILVMKHVEGRRYEEIAAMEGISVDALKSVLARARRTFRESYAVIAQRQGFGAVLGGGVLVRVRGKLRALRAQAGSMGDGMAQAFAGAPAAVNSAVTALALGTAAVAGAALAADEPPEPQSVERAPLAAASVVTADPTAAPSEVPVYDEVPAEPAEPATVEISEPAPAPPPSVTTDAPTSPGPLNEPIEADSDDVIGREDAPAGAGASGGATHDEDGIHVDVDVVDDWNGDGEDSTVGAPFHVPCPPEDERGVVYGAVCGTPTGPVG